MQIRAADDRGRVQLGWLDSQHSFSFGTYYDPDHLGFGPLRVINEDRVAPGKGFGTHGHRDMEIITLVLEGALEHRDSLGNGSVLTPGDVQRMSAGTGVQHSEMNASSTEPVHFLQIWIEPDQPGPVPSYAQLHSPKAERRDQLRLVASGDGRQGSLAIHQDADLFLGALAPGGTLSHEPRTGRGLWVQMIEGTLEVAGRTLHAGDGLAINQAQPLHFQSLEDSEWLLFDLPAPTQSEELH